ncbi:MAG: hypothetical protein LBR57_04720, partial [Alistipes sp.]|nr:hypothetical protein [Alistipes sp.]
MKNLKYFIASLLAIPFMAACYSDSADNPAFDDNDIPRIYRDWLPNLVANVGEPLILDHPVSPSDGATFTWTLDGTVISNERALNWTPTEFGIFTLRFEVVRNGIMNFREAQLVVAKPFEPKWSEGDMVSLGYLTLDGQISDVPWNDITHLVLSSSVIVDNLPDIMQNPPDGEEHPRLLSTELAALVTTAHNYGVYVMLQYSGTIAYINSAASYGATSFYNAAINPDTRTTLINTMLQFVAANGFDGMDIKMDKGVAGDPPGNPNPPALADFFNELAAAGPPETARGKYFLTQSLW